MILVTQSEIDELCTNYNLTMTNKKPFNSLIGFAVPDEEHFYLIISHPALHNLIICRVQYEEFCHPVC